MYRGVSHQRITLLCVLLSLNCIYATFMNVPSGSDYPRRRSDHLQLANFSLSLLLACCVSGLTHMACPKPHHIYRVHVSGTHLHLAILLRL